MKQTFEFNMMMFKTCESYVADLRVWYDDYNHAVMMRH